MSIAELFYAKQIQQARARAPFGRAKRRAQGPPPSPAKRRFLLEPLESRLLLSVSLLPSIGSVAEGKTLLFTTSTASEPVTWSVEAAAGVDVGSIDGSGLYTAPDGRVPPMGEVGVIGTSVAMTSKGHATVSVWSDTADGTFVPVTTTGRIPGPSDGTLRIADVDGDGRVDVVTGWDLSLIHI